MEQVKRQRTSCDTPTTPMDVSQKQRMLFGRYVIIETLANLRDTEGRIVLGRGCQTEFYSAINVLAQEKSLQSREVDSMTKMFAGRILDEASEGSDDKFSDYRARLSHDICLQSRCFSTKDETVSQQEQFLAFDVLLAMSDAKDPAVRIDTLDAVAGINSVFTNDYTARNHTDGICDIISRLVFDSDSKVRKKAIECMIFIIAESYTQSDNILIKPMASEDDSSNGSQNIFKGHVYAAEKLKAVMPQLQSDLSIATPLRFAIEKQVEELVQLKSYPDTPNEQYDAAIAYFNDVLKSLPSSSDAASLT